MQQQYVGLGYLLFACFNAGCYGCSRGDIVPWRDVLYHLSKSLSVSGNTGPLSGAQPAKDRICRCLYGIGEVRGYACVCSVHISIFPAVCPVRNDHWPTGRTLSGLRARAHTHRLASWLTGARQLRDEFSSLSRSLSFSHTFSQYCICYTFLLLFMWCYNLHWVLVFDLL